MNYRFGRFEDCSLLGAMNAQLIQDEGHRNPMTERELQARMEAWLKSEEYKAVLFEIGEDAVAYALYRHNPDSIYLRQFFVSRSHRRSGVGRIAMNLLSNEIWPKNVRIVIEVLTGNEGGRAFWRALGFKEYAVVMERQPEP